jgi:hypothetical protein
MHKEYSWWLEPSKQRVRYEESNPVVFEHEIRLTHNENDGLGSRDLEK